MEYPGHLCCDRRINAHASCDVRDLSCGQNNVDQIAHCLDKGVDLGS